MSDNNLYIKSTNLLSGGCVDFIIKIAREDRAQKHIWNISQNALVWENRKHLKNYLENDFGDYKLFIAYQGKRKLGLFGLLNLNDCIGCSNVIVWIDKSVRRSIRLMKWWVDFLLQSQNLGIEYLYASIKLSNKISQHSASRFGFAECKTISEHVINTSSEQKVCRMMRSTKFNRFEKKYICRHFGNHRDSS